MDKGLENRQRRPGSWVVRYRWWTCRFWNVISKISECEENFLERGWGLRIGLKGMVAVYCSLAEGCKEKMERYLRGWWRCSAAIGALKIILHLAIIAFERG